MSEVVLVDRVTKVPKETNDIAVALENMNRAVFKALEDGWQVGTDIPAILLSAVAEIPKAIDGMNLVGDELAKFKARFAGCFAVSAIEIGDTIEQYFKKKNEAPVE